MFLKNKIRVILIVVISFYITGVFLTYSDNLLRQIQKIRYENQIQNIKFSKSITFSSEEWRDFSNKTEIKYKNVFYDVVSFQQFHSKVIAKVVKDDFENEFRLVVSQVLNKHKRFPSEKKRAIFSKHLVHKDKVDWSFKIDFKINAIENYNAQFNLKAKLLIYSVFDPPC